MNIAMFLSRFHALWTIPASLAARVDQTPSSISQFEVHSLPGAPSLPPSWAGWLSVPDMEDGNSLFFWLVEAEDSTYDDNLISFYIPYFASAIIENQGSFPLDLASLSMGDPTIGDPAAMSSVTVGKYLESQKSALQIPDDIISAFTEGSEECGFDKIVQKLNTSPPKSGQIPIPGNPDNLYTLKGSDELINGADCYPHATDADGVLSSILNETDCLGSCATFNTAVNYLYTKTNCFSQYDINDGCDKISTFPILANGSTAVHVYSGENDFLLNHFGTELVLQNMTWNGAQGFAEEPSKVFYSDDARPDDGKKSEDKSVVGTWGEERGLSYHFFHGAGHSVFAKKGREMFAFVRDVVVA
ncbi:putative serine carboxypeptidase [Aspergillus glaucus CBS 516.65]|uniref:Uncharacterized protein n=1 Tax=Aspergillus glaucus CBS 516.65 TaxID=1160497 RepID=A0A1L9VSZ8_ASPGL|nr:hypothetical protein ASPGLDRAFT_79951 [Aspergillus glaucus CBS 516.65]OJJ87043.1 hypothetical protein ASPGLDRAFT_79951 [Aspergillus glaucus CBS 516.65]